MLKTPTKPKSSHIETMKQLKQLELKFDKNKENIFNGFLDDSAFRSRSLFNFKENSTNKNTESLLDFVNSDTKKTKNEIRLKLNVFDAKDKLMAENSSFDNKNNLSINKNANSRESNLNTIYSTVFKSENPNKKEVNLQFNSGKISEVLTLD